MKKRDASAFTNSDSMRCESATTQIKMNDDPINHVCRVLGRPERKRDVDLMTFERGIEMQ